MTVAAINNALVHREVFSVDDVDVALRTVEASVTSEERVQPGGPAGGRDQDVQQRSDVQEDRMQIVATTVDHAATPVVEFRGEGGKQIAVTLDAPTWLTDDELIARAKAMLLHAAQFEDGAPNRATEPAEKDALEYQEKEKIRAVTGLSFPSVEAAAEECKRSAEDLWQDALPRGEAPVGWAVCARDERRAVGATVDFADIQRKAAGRDQGNTNEFGPEEPFSDRS